MRSVRRGVLSQNRLRELSCCKFVAFCRPTRTSGVYGRQTHIGLAENPHITNRGHCLKRGTELEVTIEKFADRGKSLARLDGMVLFVNGAVPGDRVKVRILRKKKKHAEARLLELLEPSPLRTEAACRHFGVCGGCKWQHIRYDVQLDAKTQSVREAFEHTGRIGSVPLEPIVAAESPYRYRNKMEFSFSAARWLTEAEIGSGAELDRSFAIGLHVPANFEKVLDLTECHLVAPIGERLVNRVRSFSRERDWTPWNVRTHDGFLRHMVLRVSARLPQVMVNLVTSWADDAKLDEFAAMLRDEFPEVTTLVNTVNSGVAQTAYGKATTIFGSGYIEDKIGDKIFRIGSASFFQTNTYQAEKLYEVARDFAELTDRDHVYDLYCGAGTIGIFMSDRVKSVVGIDIVPEAIRDAKANVETNGVTNCVFEVGDMNKLFKDSFVKKHGRPDVLIVDPPRVGLHPDVVQQIAELGVDRVVYVSCNPQTMARDVAMLEKEYQLDRVRPVDQFPQTHHVEAVARLTRRPQQ